MLCRTDSFKFRNFKTSPWSFEHSNLCIFLLVCLFRITFLFNICWLDYVILYFNLICHFNIFESVDDYNDYVTFGIIYQWNTRSRPPFFLYQYSVLAPVYFVFLSSKTCSAYFTVNMFIMELRSLLWFFSTRNPDENPLLCYRARLCILLTPKY